MNQTEWDTWMRELEQDDWRFKFWFRIYGVMLPIKWWIEMRLFRAWRWVGARMDWIDAGEFPLTEEEWKTALENEGITHIGLT